MINCWRCKTKTIQVGYYTYQETEAREVMTWPECHCPPGDWCECEPYMTVKDQTFTGRTNIFKCPNCGALLQTDAVGVGLAELDSTKRPEQMREYGDFHRINPDPLGPWPAAPAAVTRPNGEESLLSESIYKPFDGDYDKADVDNLIKFIHDLLGDDFGVYRELCLSMEDDDTIKVLASSDAGDEWIGDYIYHIPDGWDVERVRNLFRFGSSIYFQTDAEWPDDEWPDEDDEEEEPNE